MRKYISYLLVSSAVLLSCKESKTPQAHFQTVIPFTKEGTLTISKSDGTPVKTIAIELATDDYERETGLMHRPTMEDHQAMLFIFPEEAPRAFYMKNTLIGLDIIYLDSNKKIVSFQENAKPLNETSLPSQVPAMYVLEIKAGLAEQWGLDIGDVIDWELESKS